MKKIFLISSLMIVSLTAFGQTHSKDEILSWLCSKFDKYATSATLNIYAQSGTIDVEDPDCSKNGSILKLTNRNNGANYVTIEMNNVTDASFGSGWVNLQLQHSYATIYLDFRSEDNLKGRMADALLDLLNILQTGRKGSNEPY